MPNKHGADYFIMKFTVKFSGKKLSEKETKILIKIINKKVCLESATFEIKYIEPMKAELILHSMHENLAFSRKAKQKTIKELEYKANLIMKRRKVKLHIRKSA